MDDATIAALRQVNKAFYRDYAASFSATRTSAWPGWRRCAEYLSACARANAGDMRIALLDVACGNARFERFAAEELDGVRLDVCGVDDCAALLACPEAAGVRTTMRFCELDVIDALVRDERLPVEGFGAFDAAVCFGFFHHVPSSELRRRLLRSLVSAVRPGGVVCASLWRFMDDEAFAARARAAHARACDELSQPAPGAPCAPAPLRPDQLERGDMLLGWQNEPGAWRYCHSFSDADVADLLGAVRGQAQLLDRFRADGAQGAMNEYLVLRAF